MRTRTAWQQRASEQAHQNPIVYKGITELDLRNFDHFHKGSSMEEKQWLESRFPDLFDAYRFRIAQQMARRSGVIPVVQTQKPEGHKNISASHQSAAAIIQPGTNAVPIRHLMSPGQTQSSMQANFDAGSQGNRQHSGNQGLQYQRSLSPQDLSQTSNPQIQSVFQQDDYQSNSSNSITVIGTKPAVYKPASQSDSQKDSSSVPTLPVLKATFSSQPLAPGPVDAYGETSRPSQKASAIPKTASQKPIVHRENLHNPHIHSNLEVSNVPNAKSKLRNVTTASPLHPATSPQLLSEKSTNSRISPPSNVIPRDEISQKSLSATQLFKPARSVVGSSEVASNAEAILKGEGNTEKKRQFDIYEEDDTATQDNVATKKLRPLNSTVSGLDPQFPNISQESVQVSITGASSERFISPNSTFNTTSLQSKRHSTGSLDICSQRPRHIDPSVLISPAINATTSMPPPDPTKTIASKAKVENAPVHIHRCSQLQKPQTSIEAESPIS